MSTVTVMMSTPADMLYLRLEKAKNDQKYVESKSSIKKSLLTNAVTERVN